VAALRRFEPEKFTSFERDANGSDEAMFRRPNRGTRASTNPILQTAVISLTNLSRSE